MSTGEDSWADVDDRFAGVEPDWLARGGNADDGSDRAVTRFPLGVGEVVIDHDRNGLTAFVAPVPVTGEQ